VLGVVLLLVLGVVLPVVIVVVLSVTLMVTLWLVEISVISMKSLLPVAMAISLLLLATRVSVTGTELSLHHVS
jgi:hypothetical protein